MKQPQYTRYALRLIPRAAVQGTDGVEVSADVRPAVEPDDDWSGAAAYERGQDEQALEYADSRAVEALLALQPAGWQEEDGGRTLVFWLEDGAEADGDVAAALKRIGALGRLEVEREPPGWEDAWRRFHKPHVIGRLYVRPPWYAAREDLLDIAVEAGLAFGTGGHASTRQCLDILQTLKPGSLLDLGTGSGVVSFAALRLGFGPATGVDIDPVAVHAAAGNAAMNGLAPTLLVGDATDPAYPLPPADVVVANIALRPILRLAERWRGESGPVAAEGRAAPAAAAAPTELLLSGLLVEQADEALAAFTGFVETARVDDGVWVTLHLSRRT